MARFLVTLSLGPVQGLIGAARRTRDLWCGSWLLSECSRATALVLHRAQSGCLVFPSLEDPDQDLLPNSRPGDEANIANILRAEFDLADAEAARTLCAQAKQAAVARLKDLGEQARSKLGRDADSLRAEVWQAQIGDVLEVFSAWVQIDDGDSGYEEAGRMLGRALAARKATRDFLPAATLSVEGLPKSSLDGARETVLPDGSKWPVGHIARRKLGLFNGEQLDALGVTKRMAVGAEQFTAFSRIAADPWINRLTESQQQRIRSAYEPLVKLELATRATGNGGDYDALAYDAQLLYDFRLDNARSQHGGVDGAGERLSELRSTLGRIARGKASDGNAVGAPVPYAVILKADGDRIGKLLSSTKTVGDSRRVSKALHAFASQVRRVVRNHRGHAVYSGGDDVLALLPLATSLSCARALAESFSREMTPVARDLGTPPHKMPTLSVGLGVGHLMEPLGSLRARAERAEKAAKDDGKGPERNALAIILGVRSGADSQWRAQWTDEAALQALQKFTDAFRQGDLPSRVAYELGAVDRRTSWLREDESTEAAEMRRAEVSRTLDRARTAGGSAALSSQMRTLILERAERQSLEDLAETLIVARWLSARTAGDLGERP